jgi:hypothetical protein
MIALIKNSIIHNVVNICFKMPDSNVNIPIHRPCSNVVNIHFMMPDSNVNIPIHKPVRMLLIFVL